MLSYVCVSVFSCYSIANIFTVKYDSYMSNTDNLYPIDKSTLPAVRFDPSDSYFLPSDNVLRMATCLAMQEVCNTIFIAFLSRWFPS